MTLVADSGALYALYDKTDSWHHDVQRVVKHLNRPIIVSAGILAEVDYLLRKFLGVAAELAFLDGFGTGAYTLEPFTATDLNRCRELIAAYRDSGLGLADTAVIATAERLGISTILTVDERHFRAVRPSSGPFILLPADT